MHLRSIQQATPADPLAPVGSKRRRRIEYWQSIERLRMQVGCVQVWSSQVQSKHSKKEIKNKNGRSHTYNQSAHKLLCRKINSYTNTHLAHTHTAHTARTHTHATHTQHTRNTHATHTTIHTTKIHIDTYTQRHSHSAYAWENWNIQTHARASHTKLTLSMRIRNWCVVRTPSSARGSLLSRKMQRTKSTTRSSDTTAVMATDFSSASLKKEKK